MVWNRTAAQFGRLDPESYDRIGELGMSRTGIAITAAFLLGLTASPAFAASSQSLYYIHAGAPACLRIKDLEKVPALWRATPDSHAKDFAALGCVWLSSNARVSWDGRRHDLYFAKITTADHRSLVAYANDLGLAPYRDPLKRDYLTVAGAIACAAPFRLGEAAQAVIAGDRAWLHQTGCVTLPAGVAALRLAPPLAEPGVWQVRLRDRTKGQTVWMRSTDLTDTP